MNTHLKRGEGIDYDACDLTQITVGLGWSRANKVGEIPALHYPGTSKPHQEHDLDVVAVLLDQDNKIGTLGGHDADFGSPSYESDVVFHKAPRPSSGAIWLTTDNRTGGGENDADHEQIIVNLDQIDPKYQRIVFFAIIHEGKHRGQSFAQINRAYIRASDAHGRLICRYELSEDPALRQYTAVSFAQVVRKGEQWCFHALGTAHESDRFAELLKPYL